MILAIALVVIPVISVAIILRMHECHVNVSELFLELQGEERGNGAATSSWPQDVAFTESLLALSKVRLLIRDDSRLPATAESSLLASVHPARLEIHAPEL